MRKVIKLKYLVISNVFLLVILLSSVLVIQTIAAPNTETSSLDLSMDVLSYQGTLLDSEGNPINSTIDITFSVYNHPTTSTNLWEEYHSGENSVDVQNGVFNLLLGSLNPIPKSIWQNSELYLGIKIGNDP